MVNIKIAICEAFCSGTSVTEFAGGYAIGTPYFGKDGDKIGMYVLGQQGGPYKIMDNALTVSFLEAAGVSIDNPSRKKVLSDLLCEYGAQFNDEMGEIFVEGITELKLPRAVLDFTALLLRINDMNWMNTERAKNTFRDDVRAALHKRLDEHVVIKDDEPISDDIADVIPDMSFYPRGRPPVALFIVTEDSKLWQAVHLKIVAEYERKVGLSVVAMLERDSSVVARARQQADNRLDAIPRFENDKEAALSRVVREVLGSEIPTH